MLPTSKGPKKVFVLYSGGMDSTSCLLYAAHSYRKRLIVALLFDYGNSVECSRAEKTIQDLPKGLRGRVELRRIELPHLRPPSVRDEYIPFRNAVMLAHAVSLAEAEGVSEIYFGSIKRFCAIPASERGLGKGKIYEGAPDTTDIFFKAFQKVIDIGTRAYSQEYKPITVVRPFRGFAKVEVIEYLRYYRMRPEDLWSCYTPTPEGSECKQCPACRRKTIALKKANLLK